jgi:hypothetical protein
MRKKERKAERKVMMHNYITGERRSALRVLVGKWRMGREILEKLHLDEMIILKLIFKKPVVGRRLDFCGSERGRKAGCFERGD